MSGQDKTLISDMMESFVSKAPTTPFVSYCVVCNVFLTQDEMVYEKGHVFHKDCFEKHGKDFPNINHDLNSLNSNAKVQLIQLKNLKIRKLGGLTKDNSSSKPRAKTKTKRKSKKKRPKRKKTKKQSRKKRASVKKRRVVKKRKKSKKSSRKTKSGIRKRPVRRRTSHRKTKR
jgi:hypothetical protein